MLCSLFLLLCFGLVCVVDAATTNATYPYMQTLPAGHHNPILVYGLNS